MRGHCRPPVIIVAIAILGGNLAGCTKPLGIVRQASDGAEALTNKAESTFKGVHDKVDAFGDRLKEKVKDLGDDLTTWNDDDDEAKITPTTAVRVDQRPTVR